jgi:hypothetical protein
VLSSRCRLAAHWYGFGEREQFMCAATRLPCTRYENPKECGTACRAEVTPELEQWRPVTEEDADA